MAVIKVPPMVPSISEQAAKLGAVKLVISNFQKVEDGILATDKSTVEIDYEVYCFNFDGEKKNR